MEPVKTERRVNTRTKIRDGDRPKGLTEQIIETHLPFFKCKLEKVESITRRPDFRVK